RAEGSGGRAGLRGAERAEGSGGRAGLRGAERSAGRAEGSGNRPRLLQLWKPLEQAKNIPTYSLPSYYKGGFEQKMSRQKLSLILGVSPSSGKTTIKTAYRRIIFLNYPDKDRLPYLAIEINEAKDFIDSLTEPWNGLGWKAP
uniref:J domain-containing protein n=1 Tax=Taeniopygia guttata TaxID=59729 RepID=A0A674GBY4_TAEGU